MSATNKQNNQLKFELETLQNLLNTVIDENKNLIQENRQLLNKISENQRTYEEYVSELNEKYDKKVVKLNQKIDTQLKSITSMRNENKSELLIQYKIIDRFK